MLSLKYAASPEYSGFSRANVIQKVEERRSTKKKKKLETNLETF